MTNSKTFTAKIKSIKYITLDVYIQMLPIDIQHYIYYEYFQLNYILQTMNKLAYENTMEYQKYIRNVILTNPQILSNLLKTGQKYNEDERYKYPNNMLSPEFMSIRFFRLYCKFIIGETADDHNMVSTEDFPLIPEKEDKFIISLYLFLYH
jgi:hypothetical protein